MPRITNISYFKSFALELDSKLGRISAISRKHPGGIGGYHEYILKDTISNFLSKRYSIKTGFIYIDENNISPQIDLMVIDENEGPCIIAQYDDFVIVYPEAVCCVVEVKSKLEKKDFIDAADLVRKIKRLGMSNRRNRKVIGCLVFGFTGTELNPAILDGWYKEQERCSHREYPDLILSLRRGMLMKWNAGDKWAHHFALGDDEELKWKSLSIFVATIIKFCYLQAGIDRNPFEHFAFIQNMLVSRQFLLYGKGLQNR